MCCALKFGGSQVDRRHQIVEFLSLLYFQYMYCMQTFSLGLHFSTGLPQCSVPPEKCQACRDPCECTLPTIEKPQQECTCRPPPVVTKGDVEAERQRLKLLEAQPIKKIAEAKARKKKRLQVRLLSPHPQVLYS